MKWFSHNVFESHNMFEKSLHYCNFVDILMEGYEDLQVKVAPKQIIKVNQFILQLKSLTILKAFLTVLIFSLF